MFFGFLNNIPCISDIDSNDIYFGNIDFDSVLTYNRATLA